ncbi:TetR/AcrR family transcriptional regulator [Clostridium sp. chh4-2]|uniref:TetR/AcrR family transcriptional regulator n=1 Tax=Clostridium sp. chh4-2 TaxID=2067550 RepID=UPI000CCFAAD8|nr:TetR/AcrR family transcriptional regulator [Clostridium sp. chh4-2]PNV59829.1 TetR/AcrR family transcriptional regulator [Clostridium sp. chh4-2]
MSRHKEPEVRKSELLDAAQKLFAEKGYAKTTVTDILNVHGLSKGVFYYYFKSKEEVMDAIIQRMVDDMADHARKIVEDPDMTPPQKIFAILMGQGQSEEMIKGKEDMTRQFHEVQNAEMHQKSLALSIKNLAPVMAEIFKEDNGADAFSTDYPQETMALLLAAGQVIFDEGLFHRSEEENARYAAAFIEMMEKTLGVPTGYFNELKKIFA